MSRKSKFAWDAQLGAADNARQHLPALVAKFFKAGRKAARPGSSAEQMHAFRLAAKRFRYTLELFLPVYGPGLAKQIESIKRLQNHLGDVQDREATRRLLAGLYGDGDGTLAKAMEKMTRESQSRTRKFRKLWDAEFSPPEREQQCGRYLARFVRRGPGLRR